MRQAFVEKKVFDRQYFNDLKNHFISHPFLNDTKYDYYGSKRIDSYDESYLKDALDRLHAKAKVLFNSETLVPTYAVFSEYSGEQAMLDEHFDIGPCTYTIDLCLYEKNTWPLIIEGQEYYFGPNEAVCFYANEQKHWKPEFPSPETNKVGIVLLHYVEPDHPWCSLSESAKPVIRKKLYAK